MAKYKVGDKVRIVEKWAPTGTQNRDGKMDPWLGQTMTVRNVRGSYYKMDEDSGRWAWDLSTIAGLAETENKIVITTDGSTTTARQYDGKKVVKFASAQCHEDDAFDFKTGATIAFDRLMCREQKPDVTIQPERKAKYKVGDRIRVVRFAPTFPVDCRENYTGRVCTIKNVYETQYKRGVAYGIGTPYVVYEDEIAPAGYTGRAVCVTSVYDPLSCFTVGKVYDFIDNAVQDDTYHKVTFPRSSDEYIYNFQASFVKLKE